MIRLLETFRKQIFEDGSLENKKVEVRVPKTPNQ